MNPRVFSRPERLPAEDALAAFLDQLRIELHDGPMPAVDPRLGAVLDGGLGRAAGAAVPTAPRHTGALWGRAGLPRRWRRARVALALTFSGGAVLGSGAAGALPGPVQSVFERATVAVGLGEDRSDAAGTAPDAADGQLGPSEGQGREPAAPAPAPSPPVPPDPSPGSPEAAGSLDGTDGALPPLASRSGDAPREADRTVPPTGAPSVPARPAAGSPPASRSQPPLDLLPAAPGALGAPPAVTPGGDGDDGPGPPGPPANGRGNRGRPSPAEPGGAATGARGSP